VIRRIPLVVVLTDDTTLQLEARQCDLLAAHDAGCPMPDDGDTITAIRWSLGLARAVIARTMPGIDPGMVADVELGDTTEADPTRPATPAGP
jgi:hypothetical protein